MALGGKKQVVVEADISTDVRSSGHVRHTRRTVLAAIAGTVVAGCAVGLYFRDRGSIQSRLLATLSSSTADVEAVAFSPDGKLMASGDAGGGVVLWDVSSRSMVRTFSGAPGGVSAVAFSADGKTLIGANGMAQLWDVESGSIIQILGKHDNGQNVSGTTGAAAFSGDGQTVATGDNSGTIRLWDAHNGNLIATLSGHTGEITGLAFNADGTYLVSGSADRSVRLWTVATARLFTIFNEPGVVYCIAFSPDGKSVFDGSVGVVRQWDVATQRVIGVFSGHFGAVNAIALSLDGANLASSDENQTIREWSVADKMILETWTGAEIPKALAYNPSMPILVSGEEEGIIELWRSTTAGGK